MSSQELLDGLRNMGGPLGSDIRGRLRSVLLGPSVATWDNARDLAVTSWGTVLSSAVLYVCPVNDFIAEPEPAAAVPDSFTIRLALDWARHAEAQHAREAAAHPRPDPI